MTAICAEEKYAGLELIVARVPFSLAGCKYSLAPGAQPGVAVLLKSGKLDGCVAIDFQRTTGAHHFSWRAASTARTRSWRHREKTGREFEKTSKKENAPIGKTRTLRGEGCGTQRRRTVKTERRDAEYAEARRRGSEET